MKMILRIFAACMMATGLASGVMAEPEARAAPAAPAATPYPAVPEDAEISDDAILTKLFASRDFCTKFDPANAAAYEKGLLALTADSVEETIAFKAKPEFAAIVAKAVAEFEDREKERAMAGSGKSMCDNYLKMQ